MKHNKAKWMRMLVLVAFISVALGCTYAQQHPSTATGAGIGAAGGAIAGGLLGGGRGAIAGGLLGALAGGVIGHHYGAQTRSEQQTEQQYNYTPSQGTRVVIERDSASPGNVYPGGTVNLDTTYALMTPDNRETAVTETRRIEHNGRLVGNPEVRVTRAAGTYTSSLPLQLPQNATPGTYRVITTVSTASASDSREIVFNVSG